MQYVSPPRDVQHPVRVYVTDYGKHSSVILPDPAGGYSEFAYGDYDFFALNRKGIVRGVGALVTSRGATLGRRHLPEMSNEVDVLRATSALAVIEFPVDGARAEGLRQTLDARFFAAGVQPHFNPLNNLEFMPDTERYDLFNTCNHVMRRWLMDLGCEVEGNAWASRFVVNRE